MVRIFNNRSSVPTHIWADLFSAIKASYTAEFLSRADVLIADVFPRFGNSCTAAMQVGGLRWLGAAHRPDVRGKLYFLMQFRRRKSVFSSFRRRKSFFFLLPPAEISFFLLPPAEMEENAFSPPPAYHR